MPQKIVDIPGYGEVEFPESMSDLEINAQASRLYSEKNAPAFAPQGPPAPPQQVGLKDVLSRFPGEFASGAAQFGKEFLGLTPQPPQTFRGEPVDVLPTQAGATLMAGAPKLGQAVAGGIAPRLYQSALKPAPRSNTLGEVARMVETGLREGIPVSEGGTRKLGSLVQDVGSKISGEIATNPQAPISKYSVASRLIDPFKKFATQVTPTSDLAALSDVGQEFLGTQPANIPAATAQALKQGTYQQLKGRAYGELKTATVEGQKALARGLKEELESLFPNLKKLNLRQSDLLNLKDDIEAAVNRSANRNMLGFGTPMLGAGVEMATGSVPASIAAGAAKELLGAPEVKSRLAIALSRFAGR